MAFTGVDFHPVWYAYRSDGIGFFHAPWVEDLSSDVSTCLWCGVRIRLHRGLSGEPVLWTKDRRELP